MPFYKYGVYFELAMEALLPVVVMTYYRFFTEVMYRHAYFNFITYNQDLLEDDNDYGFANLKGADQLEESEDRESDYWSGVTSSEPERLQTQRMSVYNYEAVRRMTSR